MRMHYDDGNRGWQLRREERSYGLVLERLVRRRDHEYALSSDPSCNQSGRER